MGVLAHLDRYLPRQGTNLLDMLARHPELHRIAHRRTVLQTGDPSTQLGELRIQRGDQPAAQGFTILQALGQYHELGKARRRQLLVQRQVETRRPRADIGHIVGDAILLLEQCLQALDLLGCIGQRCAFGEFEVDHQFGPARGREELLGHEAEQQDAANESRDRQHDHCLAPAYAPLHDAAHTLVERRAIRIRTVRTLGVTLGQVWQQAVAQVRHEDHRGHPGRQQGNGHHRKIERVYSPVLEAAVAIGRKPAAVIKVPVSIGNAVLDQA